MIRISKLADYGTKLMLAMAEQPEKLHKASELAHTTKVTSPTVSKLLKLLSKAGLLTSQQGSQGGYQLQRAASDINLAEIVAVLDGDIAMTQCNSNIGCCELEADCNVKGNWSVISRVVDDVLRNISLQQMLKPIDTNEIELKFFKRVS